MEPSPSYPTRPSLRLFIVVLAAATLLAACGSPSTPQGSSLDLQGTWLVTPAAGTYYGSAGTTTLTFGSGAGGSAQYRSQSPTNDITTCEPHVYAKLADEVLFLDEEYFEAQQVDADTINLSNESSSLTLSRVSGAGPVAPCPEANVTLLAAYNQEPGSAHTLTSHGSSLYFNIDAIDFPIVSYDVATDTFGAPRAYTFSAAGGKHRWVVAAKSADIFYGHCYCGLSNTFNEFNLQSDTSINLVSTATLGEDINIDYGYLDSDALVIGGTNRTADDTNTLLYIDPTTHALEDTEDILAGAEIDDIARADGQLYALVDGSLIVVGVDGRAEQSIEFGGFLNPRGLAAIGSTLYIVAATGVNESGIYEVALP